MSEQSIEAHIKAVLTGDMRKGASDLVSFLRANDIQFERGKGYWEDKRYWMAKYRDENICFILVNGFDPVRHEDEPEGWIIWSDTDDNDAVWYRNHPLENRLKEIAWRNVDICGKCSPQSPCYGGYRKTIFGREFDNVCRCTFRFDIPDTEAVECMIKLVELRMSDILTNTKERGNL